MRWKTLVSLGLLRENNIRMIRQYYLGYFASFHPNIYIASGFRSAFIRAQKLNYKVVLKIVIIIDI